MKLGKNDRKIINLAYKWQQNPGFTKRKSLLAKLNLSELKLDESINRLVFNNYLIVQEQKSVGGVCYTLTNKGLEIAQGLNENLMERIFSGQKIISVIAIIGFLITYSLDLFSPEIRAWIIGLFNK